MVASLPAGVQAPSRREQILATAAGLFAERGYGGVSIDDLGSARGVSGPALYWHFPGKEAVLEEVIDSVAETRLAMGVRCFADGGTSLSVLDRLVRAHLTLVSERNPFVLVYSRDAAHLSETARKRVERSHELYVEVWVMALAKQTPSATTEDLRAIVAAVHRMLDAVCQITATPLEPATLHLICAVARRALLAAAATPGRRKGRAS